MSSERWIRLDARELTDVRESNWPILLAKKSYLDAQRPKRWASYRNEQVSQRPDHAKIGS